MRGSLEGSRGGRILVRRHAGNDHGDRATPLSGTQLVTYLTTGRWSSARRGLGSATPTCAHGRRHAAAATSWRGGPLRQPASLYAGLPGRVAGGTLSGALPTPWNEWRTLRLWDARPPGDDHLDPVGAALRLVDATASDACTTGAQRPRPRAQELHDPPTGSPRPDRAEPPGQRRSRPCPALGLVPGVHRRAPDWQRRGGEHGLELRFSSLREAGRVSGLRPGPPTTTTAVLLADSDLLRNWLNTTAHRSPPEGSRSALLSTNGHSR